MSSTLITLSAVFLLVAIIESGSYVRIPLGLVLAIAMLASGVDLLPVALVGAGGVAVARLALAISARSSRERSAGGSATSGRQRDALREQLASSSRFARTTFVLGALPGVPANIIFPLLGAMRAPLAPVLLGTIVGRTPVLALTTAFFAWVGRIGDRGDSDATVLLGIFALTLVLVRSLGLVDWRHHSQHGEWRVRDPDAGAMRMMTTFTGSDRDQGPAGFGLGRSGVADADDGDVVEGELLGEEEDGDGDPPSSVPPSGLAPS